jgi:hypothetical protein
MCRDEGVQEELLIVGKMEYVDKRPVTMYPDLA